MNDMNEFIEKTIGFISTQICPLTNLNKCIEAVERYKSHENELRLVDDVFEVLMDCDEHHCISNKIEVKEKIEKYLDQYKV